MQNTSRKEKKPFLEWRLRFHESLFPRASFWLALARGLHSVSLQLEFDELRRVVSVFLMLRVDGAVFPPQRILEKNSENRAGKPHISKAGRSAREAHPRAINDKGQVIGSAPWFAFLSATVDPAQRQQSPVDKDEREQYCTAAILRPCVYRESPNGT
jgi:hypothetical protein